MWLELCRNSLGDSEHVGLEMAANLEVGHSVDFDIVVEVGAAAVAEVDVAATEALASIDHVLEA